MNETVRVSRGYRFGAFVLDTERLALFEGDVQLPLRPKAFDTLRVLVENAGRVVSKDDLVAAVWPDVIVNDDALAQCVRDVRKALGVDGRSYVRTVPRRGYSFVATVDPVEPATVTGAVRARRVGAGAYSFAAVGLLVVGAVLLSLWPRESPDLPPPRLRIAVLALETVPGDDDERWLGEGLAEDILTELARFRDIGVIARASSFRFDPRAPELTRLRDELGADFVLQGSVRRQPDRLRVALQLVATRTRTVVWAERYERPYTELLSVRADILTQLVAQLATAAHEAGGALVAGAPPSELAAYELVLRARRLHYRFERESALEARSLILAALEIDPDYASAWELLAKVEFQFYLQPYGAGRATEAQLDRALDAAGRAVALDPRLSSALAELGTIRSWAGRHEEGLADLRRAMALNPADVIAVRQYADVLSRAGRQREALAAWTRAAELDPVPTPLGQALIARSYLLLGDVDEALHLTADCLRKAPRLLPCHLFRVMAATAAGDEDAARRSVVAVRELAPRFTVGEWRRLVRFGDEAEADRLSSWLLSAGLAP